MGASSRCGHQGSRVVGFDVLTQREYESQNTASGTSPGEEQSALAGLSPGFCCSTIAPRTESTLAAASGSIDLKRNFLFYFL